MLDLGLIIIRSDGLVEKDPMASRFIVITPARDEEENILQTIESMASQSHLPTRWIIVDDGSSDNTPKVLKDASERYEWLEFVTNKDRGFRAAGSGVVEAFYKGYEKVRELDFDYLVKFDADLMFANDYFEKCLAKFDENPRLGIGGGVIYNQIAGERVLEKQPSFHVRGATKIYRRECWEDIEGLFQVPGWDTLDEVKAQMNGWETSSFPEIEIDQLRMTGGAVGQWANWKKNGRASYIAGYHPVYLAARAMKKILRHAEFASGIGLLFGYYSSLLKRETQVDDPELLLYLRKNQKNRMLGKSSIWH
jgi:biofilm PGA synthesis N-glycosyltransferase PgaC